MKTNIGNINAVEKDQVLNIIKRALAHHSKSKNSNKSETTFSINLEEFKQYLKGKLGYDFSSDNIKQIVGAHLKFNIHKINGKEYLYLKNKANDYSQNKMDCINKVYIIFNAHKMCLCGNDFERKLVSISTDFEGLHAHVSVLYCNKCKKYFLTRKRFKEENSNGEYQIKGESAYTGQSITMHQLFIATLGIFDEFSNESFLHVMGYNVSERNLSEAERRAILDDAVEIFGKYKVKEHILFLINFRNNQVYGDIKFKNAIIKWKRDLKYLDNNT
jgi:hypothetical protein